MRRDITLFEAALPLVTMLVCFVGGSLYFPMGTELLIVVLLVSAAVAGVIAVRLGHSWNDIQRSTGEKLASVLPAVLILLSIGMLIGTWALQSRPAASRHAAPSHFTIRPCRGAGTPSIFSNGGRPFSPTN